MLDLVPERIEAVRDELGDLDRDAVDWRAVMRLKPVAELLDELEHTVLSIKDRGFLDERETRYAVSVYRRPGTPVTGGGVISYRASDYGIAPYLRLTGSTLGDGGGAAGPLVREPSPLPVRALSISPSPHGAAALDSVRDFLSTVGLDVPVLKSDTPFRL